MATDRLKKKAVRMKKYVDAHQQQALTSQALNRAAAAKAMPEGGRGMPSSQVQRRIDVPVGGFSGHRIKPQQQYERTPQFSAPGFKGKAKKARIHSQRVQFDRARRAEAADLAKVDAQGLNLMRAQAGRQAFEAQQAGLRRRQDLTDQTSARKNLLADRKVARQQKLQDRGLKIAQGLSNADWIKYNTAAAKAFADARDMGAVQEGEDMQAFTSRTNPDLASRLYGGGGQRGLSQEDSQVLGGGGYGTLTVEGGDTYTSQGGKFVKQGVGLGDPDYPEDQQGAPYGGSPLMQVYGSRVEGPALPPGYIPRGGLSPVETILEQQSTVPTSEKRQRAEERNQRTGYGMGVRTPAWLGQ